jgi:hypothetical protein
MYNVSFPAQTSAATFNPIIELKDNDTGDLIDLSDITITFEIRDDRDCCVRRQDQTSGLIIIDVGYFQPVFANLKGLCAGTYRVHCTLTSADGSTTRDLILGSLPVVQP